MAGELKNLVQIAAIGFNSPLEERKVIYMARLKRLWRVSKMAKESWGKLQSVEAKLFGGRAGELSKGNQR